MSHHPDTDAIDSDNRLIDRTLGYDAVFYADSSARVAQHMPELATTPGEYEDLEAARQRLANIALERVQGVRNELRAVKSTKGLWRMNDYFTKSASPYITELHDAYQNAKSGKKSWHQWLTDEKAVPDETLLNVMQWHNSVIEQQSQSPEIQDAYEQFKARFLTEAAALCDEGVTSQPPRNVETVTLAPADVFSTSVQSIGGYYDAVMAPNEIALVQGIGHTLPEQETDFKAEFDRALTHELVHVYMNEVFQDTAASPLRSAWFNEPLTEEISQMIRRRMDPAFVLDSTYGTHRSLFRTLMSPDGAFSDDMFAEAVKAYTGTTEQRTAFVEHLDAAWDTHDVLGHIDQTLNDQHAALQSLVKVNKTLFRTRFGNDDAKVYARAIEIVNNKLRTHPDMFRK